MERRKLFKNTHIEDTDLEFMVDRVYSMEDLDDLLESLKSHLEDKDSAEAQRLIENLIDVMVVMFDENCIYNALGVFDGSSTYSFAFQLLLELYGVLWAKLNAEGADHNEIDRASKLGIMCYIGSKLKPVE